MLSIKYIEHYETLDSTMALAEMYIHQQKYDDHFLIIANQQTNARGRKGNDWHSDIGGLWFNLVLNHVSEQKTFTLFIGLCILKSLIELCNNDDFRIKWPNDIYLYDKKICGLMCSQFSKFHKTNIGIGINTNNDTPPLEHSGSLIKLLSIRIDNEIYLQKIVDTILNYLPIFEKYGLSMKIPESNNMSLPITCPPRDEGAGGGGGGKLPHRWIKLRDYGYWSDFYDKHDYLKGKYIKIINGEEIYEGQYSGINEHGEIGILDDQNVIHYLCSGTVKYL